MFKPRDINPGSWRPHRNANTLQQLIDKRMVLLVVCRRCKHEGLVFPADLIVASARPIRLPASGSTCVARLAARDQPTSTKLRANK
jgi:hypothetical protein